MTTLSKRFVPRVLVLLVSGSSWLVSPGQGQEPAQQTSALPEEYSCIACHRQGGALWTETMPTVDEQALAVDIHWQKGLRCHDCHGGSPEFGGFKNHRDDPTFRSLRSRDKVPEFCGHCHSNVDYMRQYNPSARTDQEVEYWTSGHGRRLKASTEGEAPQIDTAVATCVDCHGKHGMRAVQDPLSPVYPQHVAETCGRCHSDEKIMAGRSYHDRPYSHNQFEQWKQSVHGITLLEKGDLSAATCNDCHGNHGSLPPGVTSVANACGTCHGKISKLFAETQMKHKLEASGLPGCVTCHGSHNITQPSDMMLGMADGAVCADCHNPANPQYGATLAGADFARHVRTGLDQLKQEIGLAQANVLEAERRGMQVRGPRFDLRQAFDSLTNARTLIHSFQPGPIQEHLDEGLKVTSTVNESAREALREYTFRRIWLACSLVPILIVVGLLLYSIRTLPDPTRDG
jgi:predicted CXXCH cytochrome family protein